MEDKRLEKLREEFLPDAYVRAQAKAEAHLAKCFEALYDDESGDSSASGDEPVESPAVAPFCGCDTCQVREILFAAKEELTLIARLEATEEPAP